MPRSGDPRLRVNECCRGPRAMLVAAVGYRQIREKGTRWIGCLSHLGAAHPFAGDLVGDGPLGSNVTAKCSTFACAMLSPQLLRTKRAPGVGSPL